MPDPLLRLFAEDFTDVASDITLRYREAWVVVPIKALETVEFGKAVLHSANRHIRTRFYQGSRRLRYSVYIAHLWLDVARASCSDLSIRHGVDMVAYGLIRVRQTGPHRPSFRDQEIAG